MLPMVRLDTDPLQTLRMVFLAAAKCLHPHISDLQWWSSIAAAATVSLFRYYALFA